VLEQARDPALMERAAAERADNRVLQHLEIAEAGLLASRPVGPQQSFPTPAPGAATLSSRLNAPVVSNAPPGAYPMPGGQSLRSEDNHSESDMVEEARDAALLLDESRQEQVRLGPAWHAWHMCMTQWTMQHGLTACFRPCFSSVHGTRHLMHAHADTPVSAGTYPYPKQAQDRQQSGGQRGYSICAACAVLPRPANQGAPTRHAVPPASP
jgi:hypothetical protein